jgi:hypothetical protein
MKRALALLLCLASAWLIYGIAMELFIAWYSGTEADLGLLAWITLAAQAVVNLVAAMLAWRIFRGPRRADA